MSKSGSDREDPSGSPHSRAMFERHWESAASELAADPGERRRIAAIAESCPGVDSMLDVGCGAGDVLRAVAGKVRVRIGCDSARSGLRLGDGVQAVQAASESLPFADRSLELVSCCDVLEHLAEDAALRAISELGRVARRYVLINVPLEEDLGWAMLRCAGCGRIYHRDHHQRRYTRREVEALLPASDFRIVTTRTTGGRVRRITKLPLRLGAALGLGHTESTACPHCGATPTTLSPLRTRLRAAFFFAHNALTRPLAGRLTRDTEVVVVFERRVIAA